LREAHRRTTRKRRHKEMMGLRMMAEEATAEARRGASLRRAILGLVAALMLVAMFATAAYAEIISGGSGSEILNETPYDDQMYGNEGDDTLYAYQYGNDADELFGGSGNDDLAADDTEGRDGMDRINGGRGFDQCYGDKGDHFKKCEEVTRY
jgi:Ca2+-binding RTX toxin-like protein